MRWPRLRRRSRLSLLTHAGIASMLATASGHAAVTSCVVNTSADDPATASSTVTNVTASGTLRDCILAANLSTGSTGHPTLPGMSITFDAAMSGATISLGSDLPLLFNNASVDASALANPVTVDGGSAHRIFFVSGLPAIPVSGKPDPDGALALTVSLRNLVLQHGLAQGGSSLGTGGGGMGAGGALFVNKLATVNLNGVSFSSNTTSGGSSISGSTPKGGGGMGAGSSSYEGGGLGGVGGSNAGGGIGTSGTSTVAGGWGGQGLGQISNAQNFSSAAFDVDSGSGASGKGLIGGGASYNASFYGGAGGFGGGGTTHGAGGFGGGGGFGIFGGHGGAGGFGGGGGSGGFDGHGGFGGGSGSAYGTGGGGVGGGNGNGGGGAGFGGGVFVRNGATFTIQTAASNNNVTGNGTSSGAGANGGAAAGSGLFLMSGVATTFDIAGKYTVADAIADDSLSSVPSGQSYAAGNGAGAAITKQGNGILVLGGANTFAGATTVSAGVLRVGSPGNINSSATTVAVAGTLTGDGSIGNTDVFGTLAPGIPSNPQGTLSVSGALHIQTGALTCFHANSTNAISDLNVTGAVTLNSVARIDFSGGPTVGATYYPIGAGSVSGKFSGYETNMPNLVGHLSYSSTLVTFTVDASDVLFANDFETPISDSPCVAAFAN